jgi:hypothetical protein
VTSPGESDGRPYDVDAEFAKIVQQYGEEPADHSPPPTPESLVERFRARGWDQLDRGDALTSDATWEDEGHFVPPEPPPVEVPEPRRLVAWTGVTVSPLIMLVCIVFGLTVPDWLAFLMVAGFVGGFVTLVLTMKHDDDTWPDDGAVL